MRVLFLVLIAVVSGCSLRGQQRVASGGGVSPAMFAQQAQALRDVQRALAALSARLDGMEQQQNAMISRVAALERGANSVTQDELAAVRSDLAMAKAEHGKLREEIVDDISKRVAALAQQRAAEERRAAKESAQKSGYNHVVEAGQTLSAIAQAYKVSVKSIMQANRITDPTKVRVGQKLFIPDP